MQTPVQRKKHPVYLILAGFAVFVAFIWFMLGILSENINYFKTPSLITLADRQMGKPLRLGGIVETGSITRQGGDIVFFLSDGTLREKIRFHGVLPDLFREGQGVVADGQFGPDGTFMASLILAKHDENYMSTNPIPQSSLGYE